MITRLVAALVGLAVLLPALVLGGNVAVEIIVPLAAALCVLEYAGMAFPDDRAVASAWMLLGAGVVYAAALYVPGAPVAWLGGVVVIATLIFVTLRPGASLEGAADRVGRYLVGMGWIGLLAFLPLVRRLEHGLAWVFLILVISWLGDTGAYFAGRFFGKRKLYPRVSPKKTWAGAVGGVVAAALGALVVREVAPLGLGLAETVLLAALLCVAGILGDLSESLLKRAFSVKDSGWILPGHGGMLDRIDSLLFVAPLLYGYLVWV